MRFFKTHLDIQSPRHTNGSTNIIGSSTTAVDHDIGAGTQTTTA